MTNNFVRLKCKYSEKKKEQHFASKVNFMNSLFWESILKVDLCTITVYTWVYMVIVKFYLSVARSEDFSQLLS